MADKPKRVPRSRNSTDWAPIRHEYVTGDESIASLCRKHNVSRSSAFGVSAREGWVKAREDYRSDLVAKAVRVSADKAAADMANTMDRLRRGADKLVDVMESVLSDVDQVHRHIVVERKGMDQTSVERRFDKIDTRGLRDTVAAYKDVMAIVRDAYGLPTAVERSAMDIAAERLKLDQRKAEDAAHKDEPAVIKVVYSDQELEEYGK